MIDTAKIMGLPIKVHSGHRVYIPKEYLLHYGVSEIRDTLQLTESERSLFYRHSMENDKVNGGILILNGLLYLPQEWVLRNEIQIGDLVFLLGTEDGMLIYTRRDTPSELLSKR